MFVLNLQVSPCYLTVASPRKPWKVNFCVQQCSTSARFEAVLLCSGHIGEQSIWGSSKEQWLNKATMLQYVRESKVTPVMLRYPTTAVLALTPRKLGRALRRAKAGGPESSCVWESVGARGIARGRLQPDRQHQRELPKCCRWGLILA